MPNGTKKFKVELDDGRMFTVEATKAPSKEEVVQFLNQQQEPIPTKPKRETLFERLGAELPERVKEERPFLAATQKTLKEGLAIPALNILDIASLGTIRGAARKAELEFPKAETIPGKTLELAAKGVGLVKSPLLRAIGGLRVPGLGRAVGAERITRPVAGAITGGVRGAVAGAAFSPEELTDIKRRGKNALIVGGVGAVIGAATGLFQQLLARRPEKVVKIRQGMRGFWRKTSRQYDRLLKQAGGEGAVDPVDTLDFMEKELVNKGIIDRAGNKIAAPADVTERAFFKAYTRLRDEFLKSTEKVISAKELIRAKRTVGAAGRKARFRPTTLGAEARRLESGIAESFKSKLRGKGKSFDEAQKLWSEFRGKFDIVDKKFGIWENNLATGKGERSLAKIMSSGEMRNVARIIQEETGVSLTNDKVISIITSPAARDIIRAVGITSGVIFAIKQIGARAEGGGEVTPTQAISGQ